jgi:enterochelin esterase-like enzyme
LNGKIIKQTFESLILRENPLKDPHIRDIIIYLPPGYNQSRSRGYIAVFGLAGFKGTGRSFLNVDPLGENIEQRMNRLISERKCGPMMFVLIDCFTKFGGNQYINSSATGRYEDYIIDEVVPFIDKNYNCSSHALLGKSSGGYGSIVLGMRHPGVFQAVVNHSGDAAFEYCYLPDFPKAIEAFRTAGSPKKWLDYYWKKANRHEEKDNAPLNVLAMAAHYSPNPRSSELGLQLPFNMKTGEILQNVWRRWLTWDPIRMAENYQTNLKKLKLIYLDCGSRDEFNLQLGARILHSKLELMNIKHFYEEFDGGHMHTNYRFDISLPKIYSSLS